MAENKMNAVLRLRTDTYSNWIAVGSTFIPKNGEVCLVLTGNGYKAKIGDGATSFILLPWADLGVVSTGWYYQGKFYKDRLHEEEMDTFSLLYLDLSGLCLYYWNGSSYQRVDACPNATATEAGILKLYDTWNGTNADGSVTQAALRDKFNEIQTKFDNMKLRITSDTSTTETDDFVVEFSGFNVEVIG